MRYFFSVGEPSGDIHGANLIHALKERDPDAEILGFGGDKMRDAGCNLIFPLADHPVMGLVAAFKNLPMFLRLFRKAERIIRRQKPDAVILIDYPGFNWHIARAAKRLGVPVFYYVPPQIWGWGTWRISKMRRFVDHVLCSLPFEETWYHERGVPSARYVGHPFFDDLAERRLNADFLHRQRHRDTRKIVALLPGSRGMEVKHNFAMMVDAADKLHRELPHVRFLVAGFKEAHRPMLEKAVAGRDLPIEIHIGKTPEIIQLAEVAISVSGSVSLELLYHRTPTSIVYTINPFFYHVLRPLLLKTPYITLVNLMAGRVIFPEFLGYWDQSTEIAETVAKWLSDDALRGKIVRQLEKLQQVYGSPGATASAADQIIATVAPAASPLRKAG